MTFAELLDGFAGKRVLVLGDLMLDEYIVGRATRISPEAPVMVVRQQKTFSVPGGAANVAKNLVALGAEAQLLGVVGQDIAGQELRRLLGDTATVIEDVERPTTRKTRVLADPAHQVLRIDHESDAAVSSSVEDQLLVELQRRIKEADAVLLSDYTKGVLSQRVVAEAVRRAREAGVPLVVNAKPRTGGRYAGATLVSFNRSEATQALERESTIEAAEAERAAQELRSRYGFEAALVTLGEDGMAAATESDQFRVTAIPTEVFDPAGAGDTTIATVALGMASVGFRREVFELAARTSAAVVQHVGVATPSAEDLRRIRATQG